MDSALALAAGGRPVKLVCEVLGVSRSNVSARLSRPATWRDGRQSRQTDDASVVEEIRRSSAICPAMDESCYGCSGLPVARAGSVEVRHPASYRRC